MVFCSTLKLVLPLKQTCEHVRRMWQTTDAKFVQCRDRNANRIFFIKTFTLPLRFILQGRRIMYLWTILQKSESELVKGEFLAMQEFHAKNGTDWASQVSQDLADCAIFCTQKEISKMYKFKFKQIVKHLARPRLGSALARLYWTMLIDF